MLFLFCVFSFILGIISTYSDNLFIQIGSILGIIFFLIFSFKNFFKKIFICLWFFLFAVILTKNSIHERVLQQETLSHITKNFSEKIKITGEITHSLYQNDLKQTYRLKLLSWENSEKIFSTPSHNIGIFINIPKNLTLNIGDIIEINGKIESAQKWEIAGFSWYSWLHKAYGNLSPYSFITLKKEKISEFEKQKQHIKKLISEGFPRETSMLILGTTIGNTDLMTQETKWIFKNSWLTHILVVSGANIAFVILIISFFLKFFPVPRWFCYSIVGIFLFGYGSLVGWEIPVIRATIMGIISYIAISQTKTISSISLLFAVALWFLIFEPLSLIYDASFGLSFAATLGILLFNTPIEKFLQKFCKISIINTCISVSLSATLGSLGMLIFHFGEISILWVFANILIGGIMGIFLILSTLYIFFWLFLSPFLLYFFWIPIFLLSEYILFIANIFGNFTPLQIPETLKIPISSILFFIGFLIILDTTDKHLINQKEHLDQ